MVMQLTVTEKLNELAMKACSSLNVVPYDVEFIPAKKLLRIYIINLKTKTAQLADCVAVDHAMTPLLEEAQWLPQNLTLEVSSPGMYRSLKNLHHFQMAKGERVKIVLKKELKFAQEGKKKEKGMISFIGILQDCTPEFNFSITPEGESQPVILSGHDIKRANVEPII